MTIDFAYDGLMRKRIERDYTWNSGSWILASETRFIYDGNLVIQERNANNLPQVTYTRGNDLSHTLQGAGGIGGLLARTDNGKMIGGSPWASAYYFSDANGNVLNLIYTNGLMAAQYRYDPYGNMIAMSGPLANANRYRFSSKEWDENAGIYYYGYRFYDPNLQRWLNRDPLQELGGINLYRFGGNNPINNIDPNGQWAVWDDALAITGGAIAGMVGQFVNNEITGQSGGYLGAAVGGAVTGEVSLYFGPIAGGAAGGLARNLTEQIGCHGFNNLNYSDLAKDTALGAINGIIPDAPIKGIGAGRNSFNALNKQALTKLGNGTWKNLASLSAKTDAKIVANQSVKGIQVGVEDAGESLAGGFSSGASSNDQPNSGGCK